MTLDFPTADAARDVLSEELVTAQLEDESATVVAESGLGDLAYWGTTDHSAIYVVLRGARMAVLALGGDSFLGAARHRAALRGAAQAAAGRL